MNLTDLFDLSFVDRRNAVALEFEGRTLTFGEIDERSNRMAHLFTERGLRAGDRLCVYLANCLEMIDVYLACVKSGVIFVPVNILYREREIAHILADGEPKVIIAAEDIPGAVDVWRPDELSRAAAAFPAIRPPVAIEGALDGDVADADELHAVESAESRDVVGRDPPGTDHPDSHAGSLLGLLRGACPEPIAAARGTRRRLRRGLLRRTPRGRARACRKRRGGPRRVA